MNIFGKKFGLSDYPRATSKFLCLSVFAVLVLSLEPHSGVAQDVPGVGNTNDQSRVVLSSGLITLRDLPLEARRSYVCSADSGSEPDDVVLSILSPASGALDPTLDQYSAIGDITPKISSGSVSITNIDNRRTVTPSSSGTHRLVLTNNSFVNSYTLKVNCMETTLYGGYNTNANPFNFLELTNITNATINGRIRGFNFDGSPTIDTTFSLSPNSRQDFDLHTAAGSNKYGSLIVTHNAPYGGLKGGVSQYTPVSGGLQLGATVPLKSRSQMF